MSVITVKNITKKFKNVVALDNFSVTFEEGKIYGLLGRNGAGKSTLLNLMTNKIFPTDGEILIDGENVLENDNALSKIYCMSEKTPFPDSFKIKNAFKWTKEFFPDFDTDYANSLAKLFDLNLNKRIKGLSTGYNSIFKLIIALAVNTPIVLFDEPVLGLDANHRDVFYKELIKKYSDSEQTIIISTHLIEEVSSIIEDVVIVKNGKKILDDSAQNVLAKGYSVSGSAGKIDEYIKGKEVIGVDVLGGLKTSHVIGTPDSALPDGIEVTKLDLQKLFIQLTNA